MKEDHLDANKEKAIAFLVLNRYQLCDDFSWRLPWGDHIPTEEEVDYIVYLKENYGFKGIR